VGSNPRALWLWLCLWLCPPVVADLLALWLWLCLWLCPPVVADLLAGVSACAVREEGDLYSLG
jgi:hypothetical protein